MIKFNQFEKIKNAIDEGVDMAELTPLMESENLSEGIFSSIMNYFSKLLGGKIDKLDKIISKYKSNEHDYWAKWADANFKFNEADTLMRQTSDPSEKEKYLEMKQRADKLLKVVDSSRDEVNDALSRQAQHIIKGNARLGDYYLMVKAKADEEVANESYKKLKKLSDKDTVDTLYKKVEVDTENARKKEEEFKKKYGGQSTGSMSGFRGAGESTLSKLGVDDIDDMVYKELNDVRDELDEIAADDKKKKNLEVYLASKIKRVKDKLADETKKGPSTSLESTAKHIISTLEKKIDYLQRAGFSTKVKDEVKSNPEVVTPVTTPEIGKENVADTIQNSIDKVGDDAKDVIEDLTKETDKFFKDAKSIIEDTTGPISDERYELLKDDLVSLFGKLTFAYKRDNKEMKMRTLQMSIVNFAGKVYEYKKKKNKLDGSLTDIELEELFDTYNKG